MRRFAHVAVGAGVPSSVQVVEVEVDTLLGHVRVDKVHAGIAVGKLAAPVLAHSQAVGAVIQGIGYALYDRREVDPFTGDILTAGRAYPSPMPASARPRPGSRRRKFGR